MNLLLKLIVYILVMFEGYYKGEFISNVEFDFCSILVYDVEIIYNLNKFKFFYLSLNSYFIIGN